MVLAISLDNPRRRDHRCGGLGQLALLADAGHRLTDVAGLSLAVAAPVLAARPATPERTWGFLRAEVLAAAGRAAVLLAVVVFVLVEGVRRLFEPPEVASGAMVVFGIVGLVGSAVSIALLARGQGENLGLEATGQHGGVVLGQRGLGQRSAVEGSRLVAAGVPS